MAKRGGNIFTLIITEGCMAIVFRYMFVFFGSLICLLIQDNNLKVPGYRKDSLVSYNCSKVYMVYLDYP